MIPKSEITKTTVSDHNYYNYLRIPTLPNFNNKITTEINSLFIDNYQNKKNPKNLLYATE